MTNARGLPEGVEGKPADEWIKTNEQKDAKRAVQTALDNLGGALDKARKVGLDPKMVIKEDGTPAVSEFVPGE